MTKRRRKEIHAGDRLFALTVRGLGLTIAGLLVMIAVFLWFRSQAAFGKFGASFLTTSVWDPVQEQFGALPVIYGTIVSSLIAVLIAGPLSIGIALFLNEIAPRRVADTVGFLVQMLAAIPSVVYGLWGVFVLAPWLRTTIEPFLLKHAGFIPLFSGPPYGVGMLAAGAILAIMITPTISSISREVFSAVPRGQREAALALGATRWEMMRISVVDASRPGVIGAIILGLGRALGETMAVTMVIGNRASISASLFAPAQTMASVLANEYAEATSDMHLSALAAVGFALFLVTLALNALARMLVWRMTRPRTG
jgi:phosphate transport system permease protein